MHASQRAFMVMNLSSFLKNGLKVFVCNFLYLITFYISCNGFLKSFLVINMLNFYLVTINSTK